MSSGGPLRRSRLAPFGGSLSYLLFDNARSLCPKEADRLKRQLIEHIEIRRKVSKKDQTKSFRLKINDAAVVCNVRNSRYHAVINLRLPIKGYSADCGMLISERYLHTQENEDTIESAIKYFQSVVSYCEEFEYRILSEDGFNVDDISNNDPQMIFSIPGKIPDGVVSGLIGASITKIAQMPAIFMKGLADQQVREIKQAEDSEMGERIIIVTQSRDQSS